MKKQEAQFRFIDFKVIKSIYQIDVPKFKQGGKLDVNFKFPAELDYAQGKPIAFPMEVLIENEDKSLRIQVGIIGVFESDVDITKEKSFIEVSAPAIIFPYIRAYVSNLTSMSGIQPILLPTYNMTKNV
jgi:preprotein translocase subunit SecB